MLPLNADGGEITILRTLAAYSYGGWSVEWPDSVPEEERPEIDDDREFGYVYRLRSTPGRMGRRFVRRDVSITAADYGPDGVALPYSGESNAEQVLNEADRNTDGDAFFEREITREGLGPNRPYVDFQIGDVVPATMWGLRVDNVVTSIEAVTEEGAVVDWRVHIGSQLLADHDALSDRNLAIERAIAQERRERKDETKKTRKATAKAQSTADEANDGVGNLLETLGGRDADEGTLLGQLNELNRQLKQQGVSPKDGLLPAYIDTNTRLWQMQQAWNQQQEQINRQQEEINTANDRLLKQFIRFRQQSGGGSKSDTLTDVSIPQADSKDDFYTVAQVRVPDGVTSGAVTLKAHWPQTFSNKVVGVRVYGSMSGVLSTQTRNGSSGLIWGNPVELSTYDDVKLTPGEYIYFQVLNTASISRRIGELSYEVVFDFPVS